MPRRSISSGRKLVFYLGMALTVIGFVVCLSVMIEGFSDFSRGPAFGPGDSTPFSSFIVGMVLFGVGGFMMNLGRAGLAGSGLQLDPQQAREDMEPWSRMAGGMLHDALDEAQIDLKRQPDADNLPFDEELRRLEALKRDGIVNDAEYAAAKQRILQKVGA